MQILTFYLGYAALEAPSSELAAIIPGRFTYGEQLDSYNFVRGTVLNPTL